MSQLYLPEKIKECLQDMTDLAKSYGVLSVPFFFQGEVFESSKLEMYNPISGKVEKRIVDLWEDPLPVLEAYGFIRVTTPQEADDDGDPVPGRFVVLSAAFEAIIGT